MPVKNEVKQCTQCGKSYRKGLLTAVKVTFMGIGLNGKVIKSRITDWLCPGCVVKHPAWNKKAWSDAPGHKETTHAAS